MKKVLLYNGMSNIMLELIVWMIYLQSQGWSVSQIALLESVYTISQMVFQLPAGIFADKIGHKNALILGEFLCGTYVLVYFFPQFHVGLYLGFIIWSLGLSLISGADVSLLYDAVSEKDQYLKFAGYFKAVGILATAFSNAVGGWIAAFSWHMLFIIEILIRILTIGIIVSINSNQINQLESQSGTLKDLVEGIYKFTRQNKIFDLLIITMGFSSAAITLSHQYGPLMLKNLGLQVGKVSTFFGIISLIAALAVSFTYRITKKISDNTVVNILFLVTIFSFLLFTTHRYILVLIGLLIVNVQFEITDAILENQLQNIANEKIRASTISFVYFCESILLTCSSWLISILTKTFDLCDVLGILGAALLLISITSMLMLTRANHQ